MAFYDDFSGTGALGGGLAGASTGAQLGSVVPGVGTGIGAAIGGGLGALAGGFFDEEDPNAKARKELIERLRLQAEQGDPVAREQLRQETGRLMSMQQGMAAAAPPGQQALAARQAAQTMGQQGSGMAGQAAMLDLQAKSQAQSQLASVLGQQVQAPPSMLDYLLKGAESYAQFQQLGGQQGQAAGAPAPAAQPDYFNKALTSARPQYQQPTNLPPGYIGGR